MRFIPSNLVHVPLTIEYKNILIEEVITTKFLGIHIDNNMNCKNHIEQIIPKLGSVCYTIRTIYNFLNSKALRMVYFACFHYVITYGLIFWGNSTNIHRVLRVQKKVKRIMSGVGMKTSCRGLFKKLGTLTVACQYIFSIMLFVVANQINFRLTLWCMAEIPEIEINFIYLVQEFLVFKRVCFIRVLGFLTVSQTILVVLGRVQT